MSADIAVFISFSQEFISIRTKIPNKRGINSFTPNGDGINDYWHIEGSKYEIVEVLIFDRWGELIFLIHSNDEDGKGQHQNNPSYFAQNGLYFYLAQVTETKLTGQQGQIHALNGHISLIR